MSTVSLSYYTHYSQTLKPLTINRLSFKPILKPFLWVAKGAWRISASLLHKTSYLFLTPKNEENNDILPNDLREKITHVSSVPLHRSFAFEEPQFSRNYHTVNAESIAIVPSCTENDISLITLKNSIERLNTQGVTFNILKNELIDIFQEIHYFNQLNQPIAPEMFFSYITPLIKTLVSQIDNKEQIELITLINKYFFTGTMGLLQTIYDVIERKHPILKKYLTIKETDNELCPKIPLLTSEGIHFIMQRFFQKKNINIPFSICDIDKLQDKVIQFNLSEEKATIIVLSFDDHYSALFIEKKDCTLHIFNFDSVPQSYPIYSILVRSKLNAIQNIPIKLYCSYVQRQSDIYSCPIFSIKDSCHISKTLKKENSFLTYFNSHAKMKNYYDYATNSQHKKISLLPQKMMQLTQSLSDIDFITQKHPTFQSVKSYVEQKSYFFSHNKKINMGAMINASKYVSQILRYVLEAENQHFTESHC